MKPMTFFETVFAVFVALGMHECTRSVFAVVTRTATP